MGQKEIIWKPREEGNCNKTIWNILKKKETIGVLNNRHQTGQPRVTTAVCDRNILIPVKKTPKTTVTDITANLGVGVKLSQIHCLKKT